MYLDNNDYQTVWRLAHNWAGGDPDTNYADKLPTELTEAIHRLMHAAYNRAILIRNRKRAFFLDESFLSSVFDFNHTNRFLKCLRKDVFDKAYLDAIYVKRGDVLRWCQKEFYEPPPVWRLAETSSAPVLTNESADDDKETDWYENLTPARKQRVACLELAKKLWKINPNQTYEEVFRHSDMIQFGNPQVFSLNSFKKWAREFAPDPAKIGGRPKETNSYEALKKR